jgi:hypothetical protein
MASKWTKTHVTAIHFSVGTWAIELPIIEHVSQLKFQICKTQVGTRINHENSVIILIFITKKDPTARSVYMRILKKPVFNLPPLT